MLTRNISRTISSTVVASRLSSSSLSLRFYSTNKDSKTVQYESSEINKVNTIKQKPSKSAEGHTKTVASKTWDEDYASSSEANVMADKKKEKSVEDLQKKTINEIKQKEAKADNATEKVSAKGEKL
eukprot:TRINITY_DN463_c0_g1_i3.p1 TRINITY_DN463_c0_g1~~TRINITY_DN463_c0_g1_i3.p1  ORF type:complete len:126 (+),score=46.16 TRINITY_DN463_c0_g1_i3:181-558(+)